MRGFWRGAAILLLIAGIVYVETHHRIGAFRLATFAQTFLILVLLTTLVPRRLQSAMLLATSLAFGLVVIESLAVWRLPGDGLKTAHAPQPSKTTATSASSGSVYLVPTAGVGWRIGSAGTVHAIKTDPASGRLIYDVHYTIDAHLDRLTRGAANGRSVVFFGDSLTFGDGVDDAQTMPQAFADLFTGAVKVINLGVSGYSPAQVLYQLRAHDKAGIIGRDPFAFVLLTGRFHAMRTACKEPFTNPAPRFVRDGQRIVYAGPCYAGIGLMWREFLDNTAAYRAFVAPLTRHLTASDVDLYVDILAEAAATARQTYGTQLLVPFVRYGETPSEEEAIIARLGGKGVDAVDMTLQGDPRAPTTIPGDGHPTPLAHLARAKLVARALRDTGVSLPTAAE